MTSSCCSPVRAKLIYSFWCLLIGVCVSISHGLKLTGVKVPPVVLYGTSVHLHCNYQLGPNESLYSVKWYKNFTEFFSFVETDPNPIHSYAMPGIYVNESQSDSIRVTLHSVDFNTSAPFRCEVSTDKPYFHTVIKSAKMTVIKVFEDGPFITGMRDRYELDEVLDADCTAPTLQTGHPADSPPSLAHRLTWYFNEAQVVKGPDGKHWPEVTSSSSSVKLRKQLTRQDFGLLNQIHLRCTWTVGDNFFNRSIERVAKLDYAPKEQQLWPTQQLKGRERSASYASGGHSARRGVAFITFLALIPLFSF